MPTIRLFLYCISFLCSLTPAYAAPGPSQALPNVIYNSAKYPHDWTEGTGTLGSTGLISIPAPTSQIFPNGNAQRRWIYIQNQSAATIKVQYEARLADGATQSWITILLAPGTAAGAQGGNDERGFAAFVPQGIVNVVGAANAQVAVAEVAE